MNKNLGSWDWDLLKEFENDLLKEIGFLENELKEQDIDFENIMGNENRQKQFREQLVMCPYCQKSFNMKI